MVQEEYADRIQFLGIGAQDDVSTMREWVEKYDVGGFPHLADPDAELYDAFGVVGRSTFLFLDDDGSRIEHGYGQTDERLLRSEIERLLATG